MNTNQNYNTPYTGYILFVFIIFYIVYVYFIIIYSNCLYLILGSKLHNSFLSFDYNLMALSVFKCLSNLIVSQM